MVVILHDSMSSLSSYCCHFKAIASWEELFKPSIKVRGVPSAIRDVSKLLRADVRAARKCIGDCMEM